MALESAVKAQVETGQIARLDLIRFDLPGRSVGYHRGGRSYTYNGLTYLPNRWLNMGDMRSSLGVDVTTRTIVFSGVPVVDPADAIAALELYDYLNAPVIISHLVGDPETDEAIGVLASSIYEINEVSYPIGEVGSDGQRTINVVIELEPPGRSARGSTGVKASQAEQQFDSLSTDTFYEYSSTNAVIPEEWGQSSGAPSSAASNQSYAAKGMR